MEQWGDVAARSDFPQKFVRLTSGLDAKSCETVIRMLKRVELIINTKKAWLDLYTREEQEEIKALQERLSSSVMQISDNLFAFENYLSTRSVASGIMHWRHTFSLLKTVETVKGKAAIDAGAFIGDSALALSELEPSAIYSFEPVPEQFEQLKRTLELNRMTSAVAENMALGAKSGTATMHVSGGASTYLGVEWIKSKEDAVVPLCALDDYVAERSLQVGLIKTDIEGAEPDFLAGAKKTICEQRPILLISIYHTARDFFEIKPLIESWNLGYRFSIHHPTLAYSYACNEILLIGEVEE